MSVPLQVNGDGLSGFRQFLKVRAEPLAGRNPAMQQNQRLSLAVKLCNKSCKPFTGANPE
jgi:hypothetical protein